MTFYELLYKVVDLLEREGRVSFRALKREFAIDDEILDDLRQELVDVKQVVRVVDNDILELIPEKMTGNKEEKPKKSIQFEEAIGKKKEPVISQLVHENITEKTKKQTPTQTKKLIRKKDMLTWIGAALVLVGVLLPWVSVSIQLEGSGSHYSTASGLDLTQGLLSIAAGLIGSIAGIVAAKNSLSSKWLNLLILIAGVVVVGFTFDVIDGVSRSDLNLGGYRNIARFRQSPELGAYITLVGGFLLFLGGFIALLRKKGN